MKLFSLSILSAAILSFGGNNPEKTFPTGCGAAPPPSYCTPGRGLLCSKGSWTCVPAGGCIATCPDGYEYRVCTEDGFPINYFADPCREHQTPLPADPSGCGVNRTECAATMKAVCAKGVWTCEPAEDVPAETGVRITSLSPDVVSGRATITIEGTGFQRRGNVVFFNGKQYSARTVDEHHISFSVGGKQRPCFANRNRACSQQPTGLPESGPYTVVVRANGELSNALILTIE